MKLFWILIVIGIVIVFGPAILKWLGIIFKWFSNGSTFLYKTIKLTGYSGLLG